MFIDCRGLPLNASNAETVDLFDRTVTHFLSHSQKTSDFLNQTLQADPHFVLGHVARGFFVGLLAQSRYDPLVEHSLRQAEEDYPQRDENPREKAYIQALSFWHRGQWRQAVQTLDQIVSLYPLDALAIKLSQGINFMLGDKENMYDSTGKALPQWSKDTPDYGYILGCHAFGLEELGYYQEAETIGQQAIELSPNNTWGLHAITHVKEMCRRRQEGIAWMIEHEPYWQQGNNLRYHMYWHWALFHLDLGEYEQVLDLYDRFIRQERTDDYRDMSNAISLLWRLEAEGAPIGDRWEELGRLALSHLGDHKLVFADAHYLMALIKGGYLDQAERFIQSSEERDSSDSDQAEIRKAVGLPLLEGILAVANERPEQALERLAPICHRIQSIGGSHAQRDLFQRLLIDAACKTNKRDLAASLLERRSRYWAQSHWGEKKKQEIQAVTLF